MVCGLNFEMIALFYLQPKLRDIILLKETLQETKELRRNQLHPYPETAMKEVRTGKVIQNFLNRYPPDQIITGVGGTGLLAIFNGRKKGKTVLFRCELDALPLVESNEFEYHSTIKGKGHLCGHDGHMSILCTLAAWLSQNRPEFGRVILLFQPGEETGQGAKSVLADPQFTSLHIDYVFALHNLPGYEKNVIVTKPNSFTAAVNSIIVNYQGRTAHAGQPETGINPALAISDLVREYQKMHRNDIGDPDFKLATPVFINMGSKAYGTSAGKGEVHYTFRTWDNDNMDLLEKEAEKRARSIGEKYGLETKIRWTEPFAANVNHPEAFKYLEKAIARAGLKREKREYPFRWGEDFGLFTRKYKGAMFGLGAGKDLPDLHDPFYDYPDDITGTGFLIFKSIMEEVLHE